MALSIDQLMLLAEESSLLDQVEAGLRRAKKRGAADHLMKLQQDAGIDLQKAFGTYEGNEGPRTARLHSVYEEVTPDRLSATLQESYSALPDGDLKTTLGMLMPKLQTSVPATALAPPKRMGR